MLNGRQLFEMSQVDIENIDTASLVDIDTVKIDHDLPYEEKILSFISQIGNPYCFLSGDIPVRVRFVTDDRTLSQSLVNFFSLLKRR